MKLNVLKYFLTIFLLSVVNTAMAEKSIEFDGGYVQTIEGSYIELEQQEAFTTLITKAGMSMMKIFKLPKNYYVVDKQKMVSIPIVEFKGIIIKGNHKFKSFSLHPLTTRELNSDEGLFENHGPATKDNPLYVPGTEIGIRTKSLGSDSYYFQPKDKLIQGEYVAWIGKKFWLFELK